MSSVQNWDVNNTFVHICGVDTNCEGVLTLDPSGCALDIVIEVT